MNRFFLHITGIVLLSLLTACTPPPPPVLGPAPLMPLSQIGARAIQQGARVQFILPINQYFEPQTTDLKENKIPTLKRIASYLHNFAVTHTVHYPIKVYAYTGTILNQKDRVRLSNEYAQVIASFMWQYGFTPKQLRVVGFGAAYPIASDYTPAGNQYNNRVIIQVN